MNITTCPYCGGRVISISIGWKCESCQGFIDMRGQFHEHKEEPFMPPLTNADIIRRMSDEEMATELLPLFEELCEDGIPSTDYMRFWLKQPAEEDT